MTKPTATHPRTCDLILALSECAEGEAGYCGLTSDQIRALLLRWELVRP